MNTDTPKIVVTAIAAALIVYQLMWKSIDMVALGLIALAVLPWLSSILEMAELPGGIKFQFAKVKREQERQAEELAWIKMLIRLVMSDYERTHLRNFAKEGPFMVDVQKGSGFEWELRHLLSLQLIERLPGKGIRSLFGQRRTAGGKGASEDYRAGTGLPSALRREQREARVRRNSRSGCASERLVYAVVDGSAPSSRGLREPNS